nr:hypothetical protein [Tanacetum cinerariifolium]
MILATARSIEDFETHQAVKKVEEHLIDEEIEKIIKVDDDVDENKFVDDILNSQEDPSTSLDILITQSQLIESTQGAIVTPSIPKLPNPSKQQGESTAQRKLTIIKILRRRQLDLVSPILTTIKIDVTNINKAVQMILATARSIEDFETHQAVKKVEEHLIDEEIENIIKVNDDVDKNKFVDDILNNQEDPSTRGRISYGCFDKEEREGIIEITDTSLTTTPRSPRTHTYFLSLDEKDIDAISNVIHDTLKKVVPLMSDEVTNDMKKNLSMVMKEAIMLGRKNFKDVIVIHHTTPIFSSARGDLDVLKSLFHKVSLS